MTKLNYEDKINLYMEKKKGISLSNLIIKYKVNPEVIKYIVRLIDKHGFDIIKKTKIKRYSIHEKERIINRVLLNNETLKSVAVDKGLSNYGMLSSWISKYKENGYNIVERKRGRPTMIKKSKQVNKKETDKKNRKIRKRKWIFKDRTWILKKIESRCSSKEESTTEEKVSVVSELRLKYSLMILLEIFIVSHNDLIEYSSLNNSTISNSFCCWIYLKDFPISFDFLNLQYHLSHTFLSN